MHTNHQHEVTARRGAGRVGVASLVTACVAFGTLLALPPPARAKVQTFKASKVKRGVATFRLRGASVAGVQAARVVGPRGTRRVAVSRVRRGVRRGFLKVRIARKARRARRGSRTRRAQRQRLRAQRLRKARRKQGLPKHPMLVLEAPDPQTDPSPAPSQSTNCLGQAFDVSSFRAGNWPPGCWRPYADSSPFNQLIPANARVHARSAEMVQKLLAAGPMNPGRAGIADTSTDFYKPVYFGRSTDPEYTIRGGSAVAPYDIDGHTVRMPEQARPAGGGDGHLTVVYNGYEYGFYNAELDQASRTITTAAGRRIPMSGDGLHGGSTASRFGNLAGRIRAPELEAGVINHALFMTANSIASTAVYPADKSDGGKDTAQGYPPMGTRFQLAMSDAEIDALAVPAWKKTVLRALKNYGGYLGDSTSSPWTAMSFESGSTYTSFGYEDRMVTFARANNLPSYNDSSVGRTVYRFDLHSGVDWGRCLRVIDPCVTQRTC